MRRYELMLLLRPDLEDDKLQAAVEKVTRAIVNDGGSLSKVSPWGKRRLAYDIDRHRGASYFLIHFDIEPSQVREIERGLLISDEILRHLVTVIEDRGPVDEVPPAAAARSTDEGDVDASVPLPDDNDLSTAGADDDALAAPVVADDGGLAVVVSDDDAGAAVDAPAPDAEAPESNPDVETGEPTAVGERAEG
jgi:small subunit ribosomal protein S6